MELRQIIREEISKALQSVEKTDRELESRNRKDRMKDVDSGRDPQWYEKKKFREEVRQMISEEYNTLRDEPETSIEHRSGLRDFDVPSGTDGRWYMDEDGNVDQEKIEEAAERAAKKFVNEMGEDTFRARAKNARGFDHLYEIFQDMRRFLPRDPEMIRREMAKGMGRESLEEAIRYIARMYDMQGIRQQAKDARSTGDLIGILDRMAQLRGAENLNDDLIQQMSNPELRNMIDQFDRLYIDQQPEYPNI